MSSRYDLRATEADVVKLKTKRKIRLGKSESKKVFDNAVATLRELLVQSKSLDDVKPVLEQMIVGFSEQYEDIQKLYSLVSALNDRLSSFAEKALAYQKRMNEKESETLDLINKSLTETVY